MWERKIYMVIERQKELETEREDTKKVNIVLRKSYCENCKLIFYAQLVTKYRERIYLFYAYIVCYCIHNIVSEHNM